MLRGKILKGEIFLGSFTENLNNDSHALKSFKTAKVLYFGSSKSETFIQEKK